MTAPIYSTSSPSGVAATAPQDVASSGALTSPSVEHPGHPPIPASTATRSIPAVVPRPDHVVWHTVAAVAAFLIVVTAAVLIGVMV